MDIMMTTMNTSIQKILCVGCSEAIMRRDAKDMAEAMKSLGHSNEDVTLLVGRKAATQAAFEAILNEYFPPKDDVVPSKKGTENDVIMIFFSGHAIHDDDGQLWLLTEDTPRSFLRNIRRGANTSTTKDDPKQKIKGINATKLRTMCLQSTCDVLLILDCCYSGSVASDNLGKLSKKWKDAPGRIIITSSSADSETKYCPKYRNSPLTACILRILRQQPTGIDKSNLSARGLAKAVKSYFESNPNWGRCVGTEERGRDFSLAVINNSNSNSNNSNSNSNSNSNNNNDAMVDD